MSVVTFTLNRLSGQLTSCNLPCRARDDLAAIFAKVVAARRANNVKEEDMLQVTGPTQASCMCSEC